jgi:peroxiredoxin
LQSDYHRITKHNTEIVFVNPEDLERSKEFIAKSKMTRDAISFPILADPERTVAKSYVIEKPTEKQIQVFPSSFLIDKEGALRFKYIGTDPYDRPTIEHLEEILAMVNGD